VTRAAQDYYEVLGVSKDADKKAIKSAYRQKVNDCVLLRRPAHSLVMCSNPDRTASLQCRR
jgi:DnaJ domain